MSELLSIGAVAEATGVSVSALRYYDELEIIAPACRVGGKRRFAPDVVGTVNFVRRCQDTGFSLTEIASMLDDTAGAWRGLVSDKLAELAEKRDRLDEMIELLTEVRECGCQVVATCEYASSSC